MEKTTCRRLMSATPDGRIINLIDQGLETLTADCLTAVITDNNLERQAKSLLRMAADARDNRYTHTSLRFYRYAIDVLTGVSGNAVHPRHTPLLNRAWAEYTALLTQALTRRTPS